MENSKDLKFPQLKIIDPDFEVDFQIDLGTPNINSSKVYGKVNDVSDYIDDLNTSLNLNSDRLVELNNEIERLSNSADALDNMIAVGSGILAGIIDSLWVGEFSLERGKVWSDAEVNGFVKNAAKLKGYEGDDLKGSIRFLEEKFGAPSDSVTDKFGGGLQHHLRDYAHHPTPIGLLFSMLTQFSGKAFGTDKNGMFIIVEVKNKMLIGKDPLQKIKFGTIFWFFHMISDVAGSSDNPGAGTGLPGPILSLLKELSVLPFFENTKNEDGVRKFSLWISKLFNGTLLSERDKNGKIIKESVQKMRFDFRAEMGMFYELGRQALPVILNECIVRSFFFVRRLTDEIKEKGINCLGDLYKVEWTKVMPYKNRTISRMLTIATGTFTLVDMADAAIRGAVNSAGDPALLAKEFLLRVNFVGIGRFAIAVGSDASMGMKRERIRNERIAILSERLHLLNAKVYYLQADLWIAAEKTENTLNEVMGMMQQTSVIYFESWKANRESIKKIGDYSKDIDTKNEGLTGDIIDILTWG